MSKAGREDAAESERAREDSMARGAAAAGGGEAAAAGGALCPICPQACRLAEGQLGVCGARVARAGTVVAANYGRLTALALDPIEKKPLARFHPGSMVLSAGSYGCNLCCPFCQNSDIARMDGRQQPPQASSYAPQQLVEAALAARPQGNIGLAYTYNEPLVGYEFVFDTARLAHEAGLLNVVVTNGYINRGPWARLLAHLDAANIDLKAFDQGFYDMVDAPHGLRTVQRSIETAAQAIHVEVTTLIVPGMNDDKDGISQLAAWLAGVDANIPLHLTRFHPAYRMLDVRPTPRATIVRLVDTAKEHLTHVYAGNM